MIEASIADFLYGGPALDERPASRKKAKETIAPAVQPNAGIEAWYAKALADLVGEMQVSILYFVSAAYRREPPRIAQDELSSAAMRAVIRNLTRRWTVKFDAMAAKLAKYFSLSVSKRSDEALRKILKDAGWTVEWTMTAAQRDVLNATVNENVALIKSIPQECLSQVEGIVMRSVQAGYDLKQLRADLERQFGITKRRASLIARDQTRKANAMLTRARHVELGVREAVWVHSHAGKTPRPTHVAFGREKRRYDPREGLYDPDADGKGKGRWVLPGQLINCFPGSTRVHFADQTEKAYRHWYCGELATLVTDSGKTLRATLNHPVLSPDGWVGAGSFDEGDYLVEATENGFGRRQSPVFSILSEDHKNCAIPTISDIFSTVSKFGLVETEVGFRDWFHGDAVDSYVDIVNATNPLSFGDHPALTQGGFNFLLAMANQAGFSFRSLDEFIVSALQSTNGIVGRFGEALASFRAFAVHPEFVGVGSVPEAASRSSYSGAYGYARDAVSPSKGEYAFPRFVFGTKAARVVRVERSKFEGHVFNLQTSAGWYIAEGIVVHNCRCLARPIIPALGRGG